MILDRRLAICAVASVGAHLALGRALDALPPRPAAPERRIVTVRVIEPPAPAPEPEPVKPPEPAPAPPPPPVKIVHEPPRPRDTAPVKRAATPVDTPPVDHPPATTDTTTTPVFGVTMDSTSQAGSGPAMPVGNTTHAAPTATGAAPVKPLAQPVAAVEVTKMPLPLGACPGKYTDEALTAAVEGVVVFDVTIDEHGRARDFTMIAGLPHGLTQAAIAAVSACRFSPGERDGQPVPVRVRGYKVRFLLPDRR
jgi:periplasmic protein TonB